MGEGCCPNPKTSRLKVRNISVGIVALEPACRKVEEMRLKDTDEIKTELLGEIKKYNYVPDSMDMESQKPSIESILIFSGTGTGYSNENIPERMV